MTDGDQEILLSTRNGQAIRFSEIDVRPTGRSTQGVRGITLDGQAEQDKQDKQGGKDEVVSLAVLNPDESSADRFFLRLWKTQRRVDEYRVQSRAGKGIITMRTTDKTGEVVGVRQVTDEDHLMLITNTGRIIRLRIRELRTIVVTPKACDCSISTRKNASSVLLCWQRTTTKKR